MPYRWTNALAPQILFIYVFIYLKGTTHSNQHFRSCVKWYRARVSSRAHFHL
uniref:Uncharacterized protein n=1 Tax=Anguilla anguilla TaxID=7936 RepID=A0A0E9PJG9_ANGAN